MTGRAFGRTVRALCLGGCLFFLAAGGSGDGDGDGDGADSLFERARAVFLDTSALIESCRYATAKRRLDRLWRDHPPGSVAWRQSRPKTRADNFGTPAFYYALRMLTDIARWRTQRRFEGGARPGEPVRLTVLLIARSEGRQPRNRRELARGSGTRVNNRLDLRLRNSPEVISQSLWLFGEWVPFITRGRLVLETSIVALPRLTVPVYAAAGPRPFAGLDDRAWAKIWTAVDPEIRDRTDWWWELYPSHVPRRQRDFERAEFITGGMGLGPKGEPVFIIDDLWLIEKPPHLGSGPYSDVERRAYLPQWLQHEFFHHLFQLYPGFGLEAEGHQWFDRIAWPGDFDGTYEADYFHEALHKRLLSADPPLHETLRYARPVSPAMARLDIADLTGTYRRSPVENDWHVGELTETKNGDGLIWRNRTGIAWRLRPELASGRLVSGPDNPYFETVAEPARDFTLVLEGRGDPPAVAGFRFQGEFYRRD